MTAVVEIAEVTVRRGQSLLLDRIDLTVCEGDRWVVIGPNGAGKTTLLRVLATQIHPTCGVAGILGEVLGAVDVFDLRPRIGLASSALAEQIPYQERVDDVVVSAAHGVVGRWKEDYEDQDFTRARALMTDPELLLLDEPGAGLDLAGREALVETLTALAEDPQAPTSVMVTHHVEEIPAGITHCLLLKAGRVVAAGPIRETLTAANLSRTFDLRLLVDERDGRWVARAERHQG